MTTQEKPQVIPVDDFIRDELHPGYAEAFGTQSSFDPVQYALRNVFKVPGA